MLGHTDLATHYQLLFSLIQHHKYTLTELENMIPYELELYVNFLVAFLKEQDDKKSTTQ